MKDLKALYARLGIDPYPTWGALDHALMAWRCFARRHDTRPQYKRSKRKLQPVTDYAERVAEAHYHVQRARELGFRGRLAEWVARDGRWSE